MRHVKAEMAALTKTFRKTAGSQAAAPVRLRPLTVKLTPAVVDAILHEVARRKRDRLPNRSIQGVVTEAIALYLEAAPSRRKAG